MPRDRRRRGHASGRRGRGRTRTLLSVLLIAVTASLVIGSLAEVHAQSGTFRTSIDTGYGALASRVVDASNQTGGELAALMETAAQLPNAAVPRTARDEIQQGLDEAVGSTSEQASQAAGLVPPYPSGSVSARFTEVMADRWQATAHLRTSIDGLLGMAPLPVAGAPSHPSREPTSLPETAAALAAKVPAVSVAMAAAGLQFQQADDDYRQLVAYVRRQHIPVHLPASVWVPSPAEDAPLSPVRLGASASALAGSVALIPFHQLVITAAGLVPAAVPPPAQAVAASGGPGIVGDSCTSPSSAVPGPTPAVLPPTRTVQALLTVTNCGTVVESGVVVSQTLVPVVAAGTAPPAAGQRGGTTQTRITLSSGSSVALSLPPLPVAGGHLYELTLAVAIPPSANPAGSSQEFLIQISS
jgi:hypothetical protein